MIGALNIALIVMTGQVPNPPYYTSPNWSVFKNDDDCSMVSSYDGGTILWIGYNFGLNKVTFVISDPAFKSVTEDKSYKLSLFFRSKGVFDHGWGTVDVKGVELEDANGIKFVLNGSDALADVQKSDLIALMRDDIVVESLALDGSGLAVTKLKACARAVHEKNPSDPLAGAESKR